MEIATTEVYVFKQTFSTTIVVECSVNNNCCSLCTICIICVYIYIFRSSENGAVLTSRMRKCEMV